MDCRVIELTDFASASVRAGHFLRERPVEHNLVLTTLEQAVRYELQGSCWIVVDRDAGDTVVGVAVEAPRNMRMVLTPMNAEGACALVEAVAGSRCGVVAEAPTASTFAARWTEVRGATIDAIDRQRLHLLRDLRPVPAAEGAMREATSDDIELLHEWARAFVAETGDVAHHPELAVDLAVQERRMWVWDHGGPRAMARVSARTVGVTRVGAVYTPREARGQGYATSLVHGISAFVVGRGDRCILYTQVSNPTSNAIYGRIGYEAVSEVAAYDFRADS